jgi:hypothetical protein
MSDKECLLDADIPIADILKYHKCVSVPMNFACNPSIRTFLRCTLLRFKGFPIQDDVYDGVVLYRNTTTNTVQPVYILALDTPSCSIRLAKALQQDRYVIVSYAGGMSFVRSPMKKVLYHMLFPWNRSRDCSRSFETLSSADRKVMIYAKTSWSCSRTKFHDMGVDLQKEFRIDDGSMSTTEIERRIHSDVVAEKLSNILSYATTFVYVYNPSCKQDIYAAILMMCNLEKCFDNIALIIFVHRAKQ